MYIYRKGIRFEQENWLANALLLNFQAKRSLCILRFLWLSHIPTHYAPFLSLATKLDGFLCYSELKFVYSCSQCRSTLSVRTLYWPRSFWFVFYEAFHSGFIYGETVNQPSFFFFFFHYLSLSPFQINNTLCPTCIIYVLCLCVCV